MKRISSAVLLVAALACGSGETEPKAPAASETESAGAARESASTRQESAHEPTGTTSGTTETGAIDPSVPRCLDLVRDGKLAEAVAPCTEALRKAPDNQDVKAALASAQDAARDQAAAATQAAVDEAASGAAGDAASSLGEKTDSIPKSLP